MIKVGELEPGTLFKKNDTYAIKSEYRNTKGTCECYIIGTGEMFWGGTGNPNALKVEPINFEWLIEQAEHAAHLERKYENTGSMFGRQAQRTLIDENKRLRESLDFIANVKFKDGGSRVEYQESLIAATVTAKKALEDNQ